MKNLMYKTISSDIKLLELNLKRIKLCKKRLLKMKPCRLNVKKFSIWQSKLTELEKKEKNIERDLYDAYSDLEKIL